jgi:uncharacterized protein YycO
MAMYVGTGNFLLENYQEISVKKNIVPHEHYIIEAIGSGVRLVSLTELCLQKDYIAAVRPRFTDEKILDAIEKTLKLIGKPYDFSFNYYTDAQFVCSTLVTKAYLPHALGAE